MSKHVKVLEQAGLLDRRVAGREHWLTLRPDALREASRWLDQYRTFWEARLEALEILLVEENSAAPPRAKRRKAKHGRRR